MQPRFRPQKPEKFINQLLGGTPEEKPDLAKSGSPMFFVSKDDPPFLILHSIEDPLVPFEQSNNFAKKLETEGVKVQLMKINSDTHVPMTEANVRAVFEFFKDHIEVQQEQPPKP